MIKEQTAPRGKAVVLAVFGATREELARVGYRALRIDDVATRSAVHKTTIYRRWPTKADLVRATLLSLSPTGVVHDTGDLRTDLVLHAMSMLEFARTPEGRALLRMLAGELAEPELGGIVKAIHSAKEVAPRLAIRKAVERGEVAPDVDAQLLLDTLFGAIHRKLLFQDTAIDERYLGRTVDLLLHGAAPRDRPATRRSGTAPDETAASSPGESDVIHQT